MKDQEALERLKACKISDLNTKDIIRVLEDRCAAMTLSANFKSEYAAKGEEGACAFYTDSNTDASTLVGLLVMEVYALANQTGIPLSVMKGFINDGLDSLGQSGAHELLKAAPKQ